MNKLSNQTILIVCEFVSMVLMCIAWPTLQKTCITLLPARWIALQNVVVSVSGVVFAWMWKNEKFRQLSINGYLPIAVIEILFGTILSFLMMFNFNVWVYAIGQLICTSVISVYIGRMTNAFRAIIFKDRERENYDNNIYLWSNAAAILGFFLSLLKPPPLNISLLLWGISWIFSIGWIIVYIKNKNIIKA